VERITDVCLVYEEARKKSSNIMITCTDEKTGIQATNNIKTEPMQKGKCQRKDSEYKRNGTTCLIAGLDVRTGKIRSYTQGETRNEEDFLNHIKEIVDTDLNQNI